MKAEKAKIYGVDLVGSADRGDIIRTDDAVGLDFEIGDSEIHSDFDKCYPWSDMREVVDDKGNVFVRIPKFYVKITKNTDGTYKHQISGYRYDGFSTLFIDGEGNELDYVDVGKYEGSMDNGAYDAPVMRSVAGATVKVNINIVDYRKACMNNGRGYQQYDWLIDLMIRELFLVEFANPKLQDIMYGYMNGNSAAITTGHSDEVCTPSGSPVSNTDGHHACKYRGIENPSGNVCKWCDGITFGQDEDNGGNGKVYICTDPTKYKSESYDAPYFYVGDSTMSDDDCIKDVKYFDKFPLLCFPTDTSASSDGYYGDYFCPPYGTVLLVGGVWNYDDNGGLWCWACDYDASYSYSFIGGRLCRKPL